MKKENEWCIDCKEYDYAKHCCPRFNNTIKDTVDELKSFAAEKLWIPCSEKLPEMKEFGSYLESDDCIVTIQYGNETGEEKLIVGTNAKYIDGEWCCSKLISFLSHVYRKCEVIAWMPIPQPYGG